MASKLTKAQKRELETLYIAGAIFATPSTERRIIDLYDKLVEYGYAVVMATADITIYSYILTESGLQLARELFADDTEDSTPEADSGVTLDSEPATLLTDDLLAESRAGWGKRLDTLYADSRKVTGHSRPPRRNRRNQPISRQNKAQGSRKVSFTMNGANVENNTAKAQNWRNMRNLHNATAMPTPQITGAELLARGQQLTVVEKPKRLTRTLERRKAA